MKKRILFVVDVPGWAYDDAAQNWRELLKDIYDIDILYLNEFSPLKMKHGLYRLIKEYQTAALKGQNISPEDLIIERDLFVNKNNNYTPPIFDHRLYNGIYFFYHRALCDSRLLSTPFPLEKVAIAINNEKWVDAGAEQEYQTYMKGVKVLAGCNNFIIENFKPVFQNTFKVAQSINPKIFFYNRENYVSKRFRNNTVIGWSGDFNNSLKNFKLVEDACSSSRVVLVKAKDLKREELNNWYNKIDAVVIASESEGGPLMLLEAGAVGIPVISVPVGLTREIIRDRKNGLLVERNVKSISAAIEKIKRSRSLRERLGRNLQKQITDKWTYEARLFEIKRLLEELVKE